MADEEHGFLVRTDINVSNMLAICSDANVVYGRGKLMIRGIARGTRPIVALIWIIIWILATREPGMHELQVNMLLGYIVGTLLCNVLKLAVKRQRPLVPGGRPGKGADQYSFPSDHVMFYMLAYYIVTSGYKGNAELMLLMKTIVFIICLTQITLGRLYILDTLGGLVMGMIVYKLLIAFLWISTNKCEPFIKSVQATLHL